MPETGGVTTAAPTATTSSTTQSQAGSTVSLQVLTAAIRSSSISMERFSGEDGTIGIVEFLFMFENEIKLRNWDPTTSKLELISALRGPALQYVTELPDLTYANLIVKLKERFSDEHLKELNECTFDTYEKKSKQSWQQYVHELGKIAKKAYPEFNDAARNSLVRKKLLASIPYDSLVTHINVNRIKDVTQICSLILEWPSLTSRPQGATAQQSTAEGATSDLLSRLTSLEKEVQNLDKFPKQKTSPPTYQNRQFQGFCYICKKPNHKMVDCRYNSGQCYKCNQFGHKAFNCPNRAPSQPQYSYSRGYRPSPHSDTGYRRVEQNQYGRGRGNFPNSGFP
jgi:hypothetical protein